jgi:molecular chaperone GrpE
MIKRRKSESEREIPISFVTGKDKATGKDKDKDKDKFKDKDGNTRAQGGGVSAVSDADKARLLDEQEAGPASEEETAGAEILEGAGVTTTELERAGEKGKEKNLAQDYLEHLQRLQAEFANYRKRALKELRESCDSGKAEVICKLLPVLDDFERALESLRSHGGNQEALQGVQLIYEKLRSILQAEGLEHLQCRGQQFDPNLHEAIVVTRVKEGGDGKILRDFEKGYTFKGKLIRPSKVEVAQADDEGADRG